MVFVLFLFFFFSEVPSSQIRKTIQSPEGIVLAMLEFLQCVLTKVLFFFFFKKPVFMMTSSGTALFIYLFLFFYFFALLANSYIETKSTCFVVSFLSQNVFGHPLFI